MAIHSCPECGIEHGDADTGVIVEEAPDTEPIADAQVEIARVNRDADVQIAKINAKAVDAEVAAQFAAMAARIEILEAAAAPAEPEPEPVVVEPEPEPEPAPTDPPKREESEPPAEPKPPARKRGFF